MGERKEGTKYNVFEGSGLKGKVCIFAVSDLKLGNLCTKMRRVQKTMYEVHCVHVCIALLILLFYATSG